MEGSVLVIGSCGMAGAKIVTTLARNYPVIGVCSRHEGPWGLIDLRDDAAIKRLLHKHRPTTVVYAAGLTDVDQCEQEPETAERLNHRAPLILARETNAKVIYLSTDYVFDGETGGYLETDSPRPLNHYGFTKLAGEQAILEASHRNLVLRVSGLYGINPGATNKWLKSLVRPILEAETDRFSCPTLIDDLAAAVGKLILIPLSGILHIAGPDRFSRYDFALNTVKALGLGFTVTPSGYDPRRQLAKRPLDTSLHCTKAAALGIRLRSVREGLRLVREQMSVYEISDVRSSLEAQ